MHWTFRRGGGRPPARSLVGSLLVHTGVVVLAILAALGEPEPLTFITYEIEIVSPPPQRVEQVRDDPAPAPPEDELVIERPEETPDPVPEEAVPLPEAEPETPEETREEPEPEAEPEETPPEATEEAATEDPVDESDVSGEDIEVRMEGLRRDFPEYYEGIIRQIRRCFRPPPGIPTGLRTTVYFVIREDGSVTDARFVEQSGNPGFDFEALGAITDCAGQGRFGPLPADLPYERLPIQFEFRPPGGEESLPEAPTPAGSPAVPEGDR